MAKPKPLEKVTATSIYVPKSLLEVFDEIGLNRSEFIRKAMLREIERHNKLNKLYKQSQED